MKRQRRQPNTPAAPQRHERMSVVKIVREGVQLGETNYRPVRPYSNIPPDGRGDAPEGPWEPAGPAVAAEAPQAVAPPPQARVAEPATAALTPP